MKIVGLVSVAALVAVSAGAAAPVKLDTATIERLTGQKGTLDQTEGAFKVQMPRSDLHVTVNGVDMTPALGLTCWAAFTPGAGHVMVMGDLVLQEDQVNPVMSTALQNGLEVTALHNHFFWDQPRLMFMHIGGMGTEEQLAQAVGKVFARIRDTAGGKGEVLRASVSPAHSSLDSAALDAIFRMKGTYKDGVYKVVLGRTTSMHGAQVGNTMGVNTWAALAGSAEQAVADGDMAMLESELQPVLKSLRAAKIDVVAIHQHMTGEEPRIMFLHFWGVGRAEDLARSLSSTFAITRSPSAVH